MTTFTAAGYKGKVKRNLVDIMAKYMALSKLNTELVDFTLEGVCFLDAIYRHTINFDTRTLMNDLPAGLFPETSSIGVSVTREKTYSLNLSFKRPLVMNSSSYSSSSGVDYQLSDSFWNDLPSKLSFTAMMKDMKGSKQTRRIPATYPYNHFVLLDDKERHNKEFWYNPKTQLSDETAIKWANEVIEYHDKRTELRERILSEIEKAKRILNNLSTYAEIDRVLPDLYSLVEEKFPPIVVSNQVPMVLDPEALAKEYGLPA